MNTAWLLEFRDLQEFQKQDLLQLSQKESLPLLQTEDKKCLLLGNRKKLEKILEQARLHSHIGRFEKCQEKYPHQSLLPKDYAFKVKDERIKQGSLTLVAGPCSAESPEQLDLIAKYLKASGISLMRAGLFKPRASPYSFQGFGFDAFEWVRHVKKKWDIGLVTEVLDPKDVEAAHDIIDIVQIGSRNMHNSTLLKEVAGMQKPVLLKRGFCSTYHEWLLAAEYLLCHGARDVIFCERGIRTFETHTRFTLDINAIAVMKELSSLPIWIDPSHGTGQRQWVLAAARAAVAAGVDGLLVEVHPDPAAAFSDADQSLELQDIKKLAALRELRAWMNENSDLN